MTVRLWWLRLRVKTLATDDSTHRDVGAFNTRTSKRLYFLHRPTNAPEIKCDPQHMSARERQRSRRSIPTAPHGGAWVIFCAGNYLKLPQITSLFASAGHARTPRNDPDRRTLARPNHANDNVDANARATRRVWVRRNRRCRHERRSTNLQ